MSTIFLRDMFVNNDSDPTQSTNDCMLKDTFDFVNRISKVDLMNGDFIVSFDEESVLTNIPVKETVDIIIKRAYLDNTKSFNGLKKETLT